MKPISYIFLPLMLGLFLVGCEKEIPFKGEVAKPKLVLNGDFQADTSWNLHLSNSLSIGDTGKPRAVTNGVIRIKDENGQLLTTLAHNIEGFYRGTQALPQAGKSYQVEVEAPGYTTVTSQGSVPNPTPITVQDTMRTTFLGEQVVSLNVTLNDPPGDENYYVFDVQALLYDSADVLFDQYELYTYSLEVNLDMDGLGDENSSFQRIYMKDDAIQGQQYSVNLMVGVANLPEIIADPYSGFERADLLVRVRTVSKELYQYLRSYDRYRNYSFDPTFSQPVQVFSNIENGFGVFGGYSEAQVRIRL